MSVKRIVPNVSTRHPDLSRAFYVDFLGLRVAMDLGWIATYVSPTEPKAQVSVVIAGEGSDAGPTISVEVDDLDRVHAEAVSRGFRVVYPLTEEPWGVRRFWVEDPNGMVFNVMSHSEPAGHVAKP